MKPWYCSKTIVLNAIIAGLSAFEAGTHAMREYLPEQWWVMVAIGLPVINVMLRVITTGPVAFKRD